MSGSTSQKRCKPSNMHSPRDSNTSSNHLNFPSRNASVSCYRAKFVIQIIPKLSNNVNIPITHVSRMFTQKRGYKATSCFRCITQAK